MIPTIIWLSKESYNLVLTILLKDNKRDASTVDFLELDGAITTGDQKIASSCDRPSWPDCSLFGEWPEGMLRSLKSLCSPRDRKEQLPQFSSDIISCRVNAIRSGHSSPPVFMQSPLLAPGRSASARQVLEGPLASPAPKAMMSAMPMRSAKELMRSGAQLAMPVAKPTPVHAITPLAVQEENAAAHMNHFLLQQAQRARYNQPDGNFSVTGAGKYQEGPLLLDRQHSPRSPLDHIDSLDCVAPPPVLGVPTPKPTDGVPSSSKLGRIPTAAAGLPRLPAPGTMPLKPLVSAFAAAASSPPAIFGFTDKENPAKALDGSRPAKSFEWVVDKLLDMSVSSLLASSPRHLSRQHQQAHFGTFALPESSMSDGC